MEGGLDAVEDGGELESDNSRANDWGKGRCSGDSTLSGMSQVDPHHKGGPWSDGGQLGAVRVLLQV